MKKLFLAVTLLLAGAAAAWAVPAYPGPVTRTQPDGSTLKVRLHGDESRHWTTTEDGRLLVRTEDGFLREALATRSFIPTGLPSRRQAPAPSRVITQGSKNFIVLLIEFSDVKFTHTNAEFDQLLNSDGYNGTGSVRDYYLDQSDGQLNPHWDVFGPITVSGTMADYGANDDEDADVNPDGLLAEACKLWDSKIDFSKYDNDGDGYVDNVYYFYAGYGEAHGAEENTIWPHAWGLYGNYQTVFDGVTVFSYACGSELMGASSRDGTAMDGIGTFCHEFGHVLGLPDFYDTDYSDNGSAKYTPGAFSLMDSGCYNNNSCSPPNLGAVELDMLGWMTLPDPVSSDGSHYFSPVADNSCAVIPTGTDGETFLLEYRDGTGWDSYITYGGTVAKGILIYQIDRSKTRVGSSTARSYWDNGYNINCYASHPCYRIIPAQTGNNYSKWPFAGVSGVYKYTPVAWNGTSNGMALSEMSVGSTASFTVTTDYSRYVSGTVTGSDGKAVSGVTVTLSDPQSSAAPASRKLSRAPRREASVTVTTGSDGSYSLTVPDGAGTALVITAEKSGYIPKSVSITLTAGEAKVDFTLYTAAEGEPSDLIKYDPESDMYIVGYQDVTNYPDVVAAVHFDAEELYDFAGAEFSTISFLANCSSVTAAKVFVFFDSELVLEQNTSLANKKMTTVDVSDAGLAIPSGKGIYIGYALKGTDNGSPIVVDDSDADGVSNFAGTSYDLDPSEWEQLGPELGNVVISARVVRGTGGTSGMEHTAIFAAGIKSIVKVSGKYMLSEAGDEPSQVVWYLDGVRKESVRGADITSGLHTVTAEVSYSDGSIEEITVQVTK